MVWLLPLLLVAPANAEALLQAGIALANENQFKEARALFAEARVMAPQWAMPHLYWGIAETTLVPESTAAVAALTQAFALAPRNPRVNYYLGIVNRNLGRWPEAVTAFATARDLKPNLLDVSFQLGMALWRAGRENEAITALALAVAEDPAHGGALAALAELYEKHGQVTSAEGALQSIARLQPEVAYPWFRLAQFYERHGQPAKARQARGRGEAAQPKPTRKMRDLKPARR
jgi:predicted Zn-dependent protease